MRNGLRDAAVGLVFVLLATANAGGYRYGVSDQAFHVPALAHLLDPSLFPRDRQLLAAQTSRTLGYYVFVPFARTPDDIPRVFLVAYVLGAIALAFTAAHFVRAAGGSGWAVTAALLLLTLRHRIARTGVNSIEGYLNPRMLAFAIGVGALAAVLRQRLALACGLTLAAAIVHPTTGLWFAGVVGVATLVVWNRRWMWIAVSLTATGVMAWLALWAPRMDDAWRQVFEEKDYVFSLEWPVYAWATNLVYLVFVWTTYRRRRALAVLAPGERALVFGLTALFGGFLVSLPLSAEPVALVVQLQVSRVFWVLDVVAVMYLAWWLLDDIGARRSIRWRTAAIALLAVASFARGYYVLAIETHRPLLQATLPVSEWNDALGWLAHQPAGWQVLADPGHAAKFGTSVRVGALRDTVVEQSKDASTAIYDRAIAMRVAERTRALADFETMDETQLRAAGRRFDAQVVIVPRERALTLPVLYENSRFVVHDLR